MDKSHSGLTSETKMLGFVSVMSYLAIISINMRFQRGDAVLPYIRRFMLVDNSEIL